MTSQLNNIWLVNQLVKDNCWSRCIIHAFFHPDNCEKFYLLEIITQMIVFFTMAKRELFTVNTLFNTYRNFLRYDTEFGFNCSNLLMIWCSAMFFCSLKFKCALMFESFWIRASYPRSMVRRIQTNIRSLNTYSYSIAPFRDFECILNPSSVRKVRSMILLLVKWLCN